MKGVLTIALLVVSNIFMTCAWYGHLKLKEFKWFEAWPLIAVILFSWGIALHAGGVYRVLAAGIQERDVPMEPSGGLRLPCAGRVFHLS